MNRISKMAAALALVVGSAGVAHASGGAEIWVGEDSGSFYLSRAAGTPTVTRAQVRQQLAQAKASGEYAALAGEDSGSAYLSRQAAPAWTRYAGPNMGGDTEDTGKARDDPDAA